MIGALALIGYAGTIVLANWAIETWGIVPIGFGLYAPAGVFFAGLAFTLRDIVQDRLGKAWTIAAIAAGALLSLAISAPFVAAASALAFLVSELADMLVYSPLRKRGWLRAVAASNVVGSVVDSVLFLAVAGLPMEFVVGLTVGKWMMTALAVPVLWLIRQRQPARATAW
jgi:hypothetical protein